MNKYKAVELEDDSNSAEFESSEYQVIKWLVFHVRYFYMIKD